MFEHSGVANLDRNQAFWDTDTEGGEVANPEGGASTQSGVIEKLICLVELRNLWMIYVAQGLYVTYIITR